MISEALQFTKEALDQFLTAHNQDYCTEAACACFDWGFKENNFDEILSFAVPQNIASWRVMEKIGMKREGDFEHPMVAEGNQLRTHFLFRINNRTKSPNFCH